MPKSNNFRLPGQTIQQHPTTPRNNRTEMLDHPTFLNIFKPHPTRWPNDPTLAIQHMLDECWMKCWIVWPGLNSVSHRPQPEEMCEIVRRSTCEPIAWNVYWQSSLLDPGPSDLLLLQKRSQITLWDNSLVIDLIFAGQNP